jgi:N-acetylglucosaminyldiphosphoundecaprenol N-acetyl-beta-D-mannosaminyltransferase
MTEHRLLIGIPLSTADLPQASDEILGLAGRRRALPIRLVNAYSIALAARDADYRQVLCGPGINYVDGTPVHWAGRALGSRVGLTRGPTLFEHVLSNGRALNLRHFFLGGSDELLTDLCRQVESRYPGAIVAGKFSPPFRPMSESEVADQDVRIRASRPDIVWVGLGTPRQDLEAPRLAAEFGCLAIGVGAAFDFLSGHKRQAPRLLHHTGLEWVFRLATEPRRLWRRYLNHNAAFVMLVARAYIASVWRSGPQPPTGGPGAAPGEVEPPTLGAGEVVRDARG